LAAAFRRRFRLSFGANLGAENAMRLSIGLGDDLNSQLFMVESVTGDVESHVLEKAEIVDRKHKAAEEFVRPAPELPQLPHLHDCLVILLLCSSSIFALFFFFAAAF
jgi:hypothetical protein